MGVRVLPLLALALSLGGPASAADHGLKSVRIQAGQGFDYELLEEYELAATAHRSKAQAGPLELPRPYALQTVEQVKSTSTQFKGGRKKPLAKDTVVYMQGKNGELEGKVVRDLRPARQSIQVRWSTGGRMVTVDGISEAPCMCVIRKALLAHWPAILKNVSTCLSGLDPKP